MPQSSISNAFGRCFITQAGLYPQPYTYYGDLRLDATQKSNGALTPIQGDSVFGYLRAVPGLWSVSATGRIYIGEDSLLRQAFDSGLPVNLQVHYGNCSDPTDFGDFDDVFVVENAIVTDYATTPLAASQPSEVLVLQETVTIAYERGRWLHRPLLSSTPSALFAESGVRSLCFADNVQSLVSSAKPRIYALLEQAHLSGTTNFYIGWSDDNGVTWSSAGLNRLSTLNPSPPSMNRVVALGDWLIGTNGNFTGKSFWAVNGPSLVDSTNVDPYFPDALNLSGARGASVRKHNGKVYVLHSNGLIVQIDENLATIIYLDIDIANSDDFCFVDDNRIILSTYNGTTDNEIYEITNGLVRLAFDDFDTSRISAFSVTPNGHALIATLAGNIYGLNFGEGIATKLLNTNGSDCVNQIVMVDNVLGYATGRFVYRTVNGGFTWEKILSRTWQPNDYYFIALAADDKRLIVGSSSIGDYVACDNYFGAVGGIGSISGLIGYSI